MTDYSPVEELYRRLIDAWNQRDAEVMAGCFVEGGTMIGFDGSTALGVTEIREHLAPVFRDHPTAAFVTDVQDIRSIGANVVLLRSHVGMIPPGSDDINPAVNAIQTVTAVRTGEEWGIALFQNTPAAFHGRPEMQEAMTASLRAAAARRQQSAAGSPR